MYMYTAHPDLFESGYILHEEPVGVEPRQKDVLDYVLHSNLLEAKTLGSHNGRVDEIETKGVCSVLPHHVNGVGVVFETFAHLLTITGEIESERERERKGTLKTKSAKSHTISGRFY